MERARRHSRSYLLRPWALATWLATVSACGDHTPTALPLSSLTGTFALRSLDGAPLPVAATWGGIPQTIVADTLRFDGIGGFEWSSVTQGGVTFGMTGSARQKADSVLLQSFPQDWVAARGIAGADTLHLRSEVPHIFPGHAWVYVWIP
jgi:hypothetical protein